jgi:cell division protein FtsX
MKINSLSFGLAGAITTAITWTICSLLVWMMPGPMMSTTGQMVHMDMTTLGWMLSPMGFFWGLIVWSLFVGVFGWILATIYNILTKKKDSDQ